MKKLDKSLSSFSVQLQSAIIQDCLIFLRPSKKNLIAPLPLPKNLFDFNLHFFAGLTYLVTISKTHRKTLFVLTFSKVPLV